MATERSKSGGFDAQPAPITREQFLHSLDGIASSLQEALAISPEVFLQEQHTDSVRTVLTRLQTIFTSGNSEELRRGLTRPLYQEFFELWAAVLEKFYIVSTDFEQNKVAGVNAAASDSTASLHSPEMCLEDMRSLNTAVAQFQEFLRSAQ